jgi:hypothetical protein
MFEEQDQAMNTIIALRDFLSVAGPAALLTAPLVAMLNHTHRKAQDATGRRNPALPSHAFGNPRHW